ncbi:MAG: TlyA family RNA methyltransferase [Clostridia bacterium]|nr:TlyA family RNA methyltransferase [Clostridia bacterium]
MAKIRLDTYITEQGLAPSREKAKALIMAGVVFVDNQKEDKAGTMISETQKVEVRGGELKYVSRGGLKLEKAMSAFDVTLDNKVCMDIGASTGGFTDCMLQNGASRVFAVDVGYGQLAWKLRCDERVVNMERTNIRYVTLEDIGEPLDFASIDVAFISLRLVLPVAYNLLCDDGEVVALIKPQFEAGKEKVGKKGVVKDVNVHKEVVAGIYDFAIDNGFGVMGLDFSPIKGPEGNIEYLIHLKKNAETVVKREETDRIAELSHENLDK